MTSRKMLTKDEEKHLLATFAAGVNDNIAVDSYLAGLFTPEFVLWVNTQIDNDVIPNIFEWWTNDTKSMQDRIRELNEKVDRSDRAIYGSNQTIERLESVERDLTEMLSASRRNTSEAQREADEANRKLRYAKQELEQKDLELVKLKARLYDLEHAGEAVGDIDHITIGRSLLDE